MWIRLEDDKLAEILAVLDNADSPLAHDLREQRMRSARQDRDLPIIAAAGERYGNDEIEIDDDAVVSHGDTAAWVMAWLWVEFDEAAKES